MAVAVGYGSPAPDQGSRTSSIACLVADDIHALPIQDAKMVLTGGDLESALGGLTDGAGSFTFSGLSPGRYTLAVERSGYFSRVATASQDGGAVTVNAGPSETAVSITLIKIRTMSGTVKWQDGEPASEGVVVHVLKLRRGQGTLRMGDAYLIAVKEDGKFKIENLRPGRYMVYAYHLGLVTNIDRPRVALPVFYPDSPTPETASSLDLISAAGASWVELKLRDVGGVSVEGTVAASPDFPEGTPLRLGLMLTGSPAQAIAGTKAQAGSPFRILDVPPGSYQLLAIPWVPEFKDMQTVQPLQVSDRAIKDVKVVMHKSTPITGHAHVERIAAVQPDAEAPSGRFEPAAGVDFSGMSPELQLMGILTRRTNKAGEFHLEGSIDGQTYPTNIQPPAGSYLYKVTQDGRELDGAPFPLRGGGGFVDVLLRDDGGRIDGTVKRKNAGPSAGFVVLAPKDRSREHLYRVAAATDDGLFQLQDVAPGEYEIFALDRNDGDMYLVSTYLDHFKKTASAVAMTSRLNLHVDLELADASQAAR